MLNSISNRLASITYDTLPSSTIRKAKIAILNFIGGSLPGADAEATLAEKNMWLELNAAGPCTVLGDSRKLTPLAAAAVNSSMGQVFLQEDCHEDSISHPGVIVIPTVLALAQQYRFSGKQLLEGVVAGYEGQGRIGRCLIVPGFPENGKRPQSFCAPFGSVSAAAKLLGLDAEGIRDAISIAANTCCGVMECSLFGSDDMCIQNCFGTKNGIMSAYAAKNGSHGAYTILEGRFGIGMAFNDRYTDWSVLEQTDRYEIDSTFVKIYPGCGHVLPTAQGAVELVRNNAVRPEDIDHVVVGTRTAGKTFPGCDNNGPFGGHISAMMSHQFMVAAAICTGDVKVRCIKDYANPAFYEMAGKVEVLVDDEVNALSESGGRVTFFLKDGRILTSFQTETIPQTDEGVIGRWRENGRDYYSEEAIEAVMDRIFRLENLDDAGSIMDLLVPEE